MRGRGRDSRDSQTCSSSSIRPSAWSGPWFRAAGPEARASPPGPPHAPCWGRPVSHAARRKPTPADRRRGLGPATQISRKRAAATIGPIVRDDEGTMPRLKISKERVAEPLDLSASFLLDLRVALWVARQRVDNLEDEPANPAEVALGEAAGGPSRGAKANARSHERLSEHVVRQQLHVHRRLLLSRARTCRVRSHRARLLGGMR